MPFSQAYKGRELAVITQILAIFGVVEQPQLRQFFDYMNDNEYGKVLSVLKREGLAYFTSDGRYVSTSRYAMNYEKCQDAVMTFWAFIHFRDYIQDFCACDPPSILTFAYENKNCDLIPGNPANIAAINAQADEILEKSIRFIVVNDPHDAEYLVPRLKNDYLVLLESNQVKKICKL